MRERERDNASGTPCEGPSGPGETRDEKAARELFKLSRDRVAVGLSPLMSGPRPDGVAIWEELPEADRSAWRKVARRLREEPPRGCFGGRLDEEVVETLRGYGEAWPQTRPSARCPAEAAWTQFRDGTETIAIRIEHPDGRVMTAAIPGDARGHITVCRWSSAGRWLGATDWREQEGEAWKDVMMSQRLETEREVSGRREGFTVGLALGVALMGLFYLVWGAVL